jgi:hypothetical protein
MTFIRFEIINFDIFQKVTHDDDKEEKVLFLTSKVTINTNKDYLKELNKELMNISYWLSCLTNDKWRFSEDEY